MSIKTKLVIAFLVITIIPILAIGFIGSSVARKTLMETNLAALENIADTKVERIESFFLERKKDITIVQDYYNIKTNLPIVDQFAGDRAGSVYLKSKKMLDGQLKTFQEVYGYEDFMLLNHEGNVVYVSNEAHAETELDRFPEAVDANVFEGVRKKINFSDIYESKTTECNFEMLITGPIYDFNENFIGAVAIETCMEPIYEFIQDTTGLGKTGETLIGKDIGNSAIFLNRLRHDAGAVLTRMAEYGENTAFPIQEAVKGRSGSGLSIDYRGKEIIAAWRYIPSMDWGLVAKIDTVEAFALANYLTRLLIITMTIFTLLSIIAALFFSRRFSGPIIKLTQKTKLISEGNLTSKLDVKSGDEIGQLTNSFNNMIDDLRNSREDLLNRTEELAFSNKELEDFTSVVSHDLKAPLRAIQNYADFLQSDLGGKLEEEQEMYLSGLGEAVEQSEKFLEEVLVLSRIGKDQIVNERVDVGIFLREYTNSLSLPFEVKIVINEDFPTVVTDQTLLKQIFQNLIFNGIKYNKSTDKCIEIGWNLVNSGKLDFFVKDNGIGIEPRFFDKIFQPFQRLHTNEEFDGTGIGLAIVLKAVNRLGWSVRVNSVIEEGSTFFVTVPEYKQGE